MSPSCAGMISDLIPPHPLILPFFTPPLFVAYVSYTKIINEITVELTDDLNDVFLHVHLLLWLICNVCSESSLN